MGRTRGVPHLGASSVRSALSDPVRRPTRRPGGRGRPPTDPLHAGTLDAPILVGAAIGADPAFEAILLRANQETYQLAAATEARMIAAPAPPDATIGAALAGRYLLLLSGGERATLVRARGRLEVPVPRVRVVDTVGAGDTFMGALLVRLTERGNTRGFGELGDDAWRDALAFAAAAAALNCTRPGADPPTRAELGALYP